MLTLFLINITLLPPCFSINQAGQHSENIAELLTIRSHYFAYKTDRAPLNDKQTVSYIEQAKLQKTLCGENFLIPFGHV